MKGGQKISDLNPKPISLRLRDITLERLDSYIAKNTKTRRARSQIIDRILSEFLERNLRLEYTHKSDGPRKPGMTNAVRQIIEAIKDKGFEREITQKDIEEIIRTTRGHNYRTMKTWKSELLETGLIKEKNRINYAQAIYELHWEAVDESLWPNEIKSNGQNSVEASINES